MKTYFGPDELRVLGRAFEAAWAAINHSDASIDPVAVREHMGRAIIHIAQNGTLDEKRLAHYAAYQGRCYIGLRLARRHVR